MPAPEFTLNTGPDTTTPGRAMDTEATRPTRQ